MLNRMVYTALFAIVAAMFGMLLYWQVDIIHRGGPIMVPIIMCSMFALAIVIERLYFFFSLRTRLGLLNLKRSGPCLCFEHGRYGDHAAGSGRAIDHSFGLTAGEPGRRSTDDDRDGRVVRGER